MGFFATDARAACNPLKRCLDIPAFFRAANFSDRGFGRVDSSLCVSYMQGMSLEPFALTFALLVLWTSLGWSLITAADREMQPLKALFLAPATGVAVTLLPAFWFNLLGWPVSSFARPLMVAFCCIIVVVWIWRRPSWTWRELIFIIPVIAALLLIGFPMLRFGFDWVANANDDWANYNLRAIRLLNNGF